jgi:Bacteriophage lambda head decoration protein D
MTTFTEKRQALSFVITEGEGHFSREDVTIEGGTGGAGVVEAGTVLGEITASGKYVPSPDTGTDGSQVAAAILAYRVDATDDDVQAVVIKRHAEVNGNLLIYHPSVDDATKVLAKIAQLGEINDPILVR